MLKMLQKQDLEEHWGQASGIIIDRRYKERPKKKADK